MADLVAPTRKEKRKTRTEEPEINHDMILEILLRSDHKTLIRSKCVSKTWRLMITSPSFRKSLRETLATGFFCSEPNSPLLADADCGFDSVSQYFSDFDFGLNAMGVDMSLNFLQRSVYVVSSHNGFLLCAVKEKSGGISHDCEYIVCNPLTKQWVNVPKQGQSHRVRDMVLFTYKRKEEEATEFTVICLYRIKSVNTYSSEKKKWEKSRFTGDLNLTISNKVLFQESVYVCASIENLLWGFNLKNKIWTWKELPTKIEDSICLGVSAGSLYYAATAYHESWMKVWVLDDMDEWSLKYNIKNVELNKKLPGNIRSYSNLYYTCCGFHPLIPYRILVKSLDRDRVVFLYNTVTEKVETIYPSNYLPIVTYCLPTWTLCLKNYHYASTH